MNATPPAAGPAEPRDGGRDGDGVQQGSATGGAPPHSPWAMLRVSRPSKAHLLTGVVVAVAGVLLVTTAHTHQTKRSPTTTQNRLADLVTDEQRSIQTATRREQDLQKQVSDLTSAAATQDQAVAGAQKTGAVLEGPAGLLPVHGPSYTVSLDDAPKDAPVALGYPAPGPDDLVVHQQDVQAVVNALWAGGAEAMTIMGQRVIATSAVRCVGNTLLLQGRVYSPPFVVSAIGDPTQLASAVHGAAGVKVFQQYVTAYGLRFSTQQSSDASFPGYDGSVALTHAQPLAAADAPTAGHTSGQTSPAVRP